MVFALPPGLFGDIPWVWAEFMVCWSLVFGVLAWAFTREDWDLFGQ